MTARHCEHLQSCILTCATCHATTLNRAVMQEKGDNRITRACNMSKVQQQIMEVTELASCTRM
jgi:hypothetical protein